MKVRVLFNTPQMKVDEVYSGQSAEDIVGQMKRSVASHLGFALKMAVNAMSPTKFAQETVRRYNDATGKSVPIPDSCEAFLESARAEGIVTYLEK